MRIRSRGFIAVEMLFGLVALALLTTMGIELMAKRMDSQNYQIAAQQQQQVADAAAKYLKDRVGHGRRDHTGADHRGHAAQH